MSWTLLPYSIKWKPNQVSLESVPYQLDPHHPWLRDKCNREDLAEFLQAYGLDPNHVHSMRFHQKSFEVMVFDRDSSGHRVWDERRRVLLTHLEKFKYQDGLRPRTTREPYIRRD